MSPEVHAGSRIRARRVALGLKQAELAKAIGISASYLNLIEHNRRRIGGKLLLGIAAELNVEAQALSEGAEAALLGSLREAALAAGLGAETAQADDFAGRFPGWAAVLASRQRRIAALERIVETLSDRLAHDPHLASAMHEVLTTAAAIRSTAAILVETPTLESEWRARFHTNIDADSRRLSQSAQALARYLALDTQGQEPGGSPQDEVAAWLDANGYSFNEIEDGRSHAVERVLKSADRLVSEAARYIGRGVLEQMARDARAVPLARLAAAVRGKPVDPVSLARHFDVPVAPVLRRLASLPDLGAGLVICDRSGTVIFRKAIAGFSVPGLGACCPLWPLFAALGQPGQVVRERISQQGRRYPPFDAIAATEIHRAPDYNRSPMVQAAMLILPLADASAGPVRDVGATCRICSRAPCPARREPSILSA